LKIEAVRKAASFEIGKLNGLQESLKQEAQKEKIDRLACKHILFEMSESLVAIATYVKVKTEDRKIKRISKRSNNLLNEMVNNLDSFCKKHRQ